MKVLTPKSMKCVNSSSLKWALEPPNITRLLGTNGRMRIRRRTHLVSQPHERVMDTIANIRNEGREEAFLASKVLVDRPLGN